VMSALTKHLQRFEDKGWTNVPQSDLYKKITARLRNRQAATILTKDIDTRRYLDLDERLRQMVIPGAPEIANHNLLNGLPEIPGVEGVRLPVATQRLLYQGIINTVNAHVKRDTVAHLDMIRHAIGDAFGKKPSDEQIWLSLRKKELALRPKAFMWKALHNAYKIGRWWERIANFEHRGQCHVCNTTKTMEHILTECQASGQETIWKLAKELWQKKRLPWPEPTIGMILGCGLAAFRRNRKKTSAGTDRLYAILISESAHLIWKQRCRWKISLDGDHERIPTAQETRNTWVKQINRRLRMDCLHTNTFRYGKKALRVTLVESTWWEVLRNQRDLPDDWATNPTTEVLVGIEERPPGRNR
ncbi:hypothetical protein CPC08DRAFT_802184, partial [Agrocybe pediades]